MDPLSISASVIQITSLISAILRFQRNAYFIRPVQYVRIYGIISGVVVTAFGARNVWDMQAEVLGSRNDETAMAFRKTVQDESTTCAVAAAIVSQIAITALSLPFLSQAHWVAQGFWIVSLISGIMAVYYASAQHRTMGRLLLPGLVRGWIRGKNDDEPKYTDTNETAVEMLRPFLPGLSLTLSTDKESLELLEPFLPGPSSVLTISAPQLLLSASLYSFLAGLGVYVSFVWRRRLDPSAGFNDSRNIFITYMVSLAVCEIIYSISSVASLAPAGPRRGTPWNIVSINCEIFYTKALEKFDRLHFERQQNLSEREQSGQLSPTRPRGTSPTAPMQAIQNQLSASAAIEALQASTPAPETDVHEPRTTTSSQSHAELPWVSPQLQVLIKALQDSARLRHESAKLDELIARCYEELLGKHEAVETISQD